MLSPSYYSGAPNPLLSSDPQTVNSVFTNYGFDPRGNNEEGNMFQHYGAYLYPEAANELAFQSGYAGPQERSLTQNLLTQLNNPAALRADINSFGAGANENAANTGAQEAAQLRGSGYSTGATGGAIAGQYQQAAAQTNAYRAQQMSPQARLQRLQAGISALRGVGSPALSTQMSLFGPIEQRHQQNFSEMGSGSAFSPFLQLAGAYFGGGGFKGFGGSSSGGGAGLPNNSSWFSPGEISGSAPSQTYGGLG